MKIAVCCKAVPVDVSAEMVEVVDGDIRTNGKDLYLNEVDEYALEAALALKKVREDVETWAITLGPLRAQEALYTALAKGIDHVFRIDGDTERPEVITAGLTAALKDLRPDLVFAGVQSLDWMGAQVGVSLASSLDMACAYAVVEIVELSDSSVRVRKEIGAGKKAELLLPLPAVLCIQSGIQTLQYVSMMKRKKMRAIPIQSWGKLEDIAVRKMAYQIVSATSPESRTHAEMIEGDRMERISKVLEIIRKNI